MDDLGSHFKVNIHNLKIDPALGAMDMGGNQGTINIADPAIHSDTGDANMPAAIGIQQQPTNLRRRKFFVRKPGATLAEQLGTPEAVDQIQKLPEPLRPTMLEVPERIAPKTISRNIPADVMEGILTPKLHKLPDNNSLPSNPVEEMPDTSPEEMPSIVSPSIDSSPVTLKADLRDLVLRYIQKVGLEPAAKVFKTSESQVSKWVNGKLPPPLSAAQTILDKSLKAREQYLKVAEQVSIDWETGEGVFQREHTKEELPVDLCLALKGDIPPYVHWVFTTAAAQYGVGQKMFTDTIIIRSRNMLADLFLKGKADWSIWIDGDVLPTIGNAMWWKAIVRDPSVSEQTMSYDFIKRFLSHKKPFVGGVYATRRRNGPLVMQPDLHPKGQADRNAADAIRTNKSKGLIEVDWLSIGFACVHRVVFETIKKKHPELMPGEKGGPYPFFTPKGNEGEDVALSRLAKDCGFKLYLDTELFAAHVGRYAYVPSESQFNGILDFSNA